MNKERTTMKLCPRCGRYKDISQFYRRGENGIQSHCIECSKAHGRLRNGTTGIYRKELFENSNKQTIMEDFTFFDFATASRAKIKENTFSFIFNENDKHITFSQEKTKEIVDGGFLFLRIRKDNITGDLHFVFTKDTGMPIHIKKGMKNLSIFNKQMSVFLAGELGLRIGERRMVSISNNMSNTTDFLTYKIIK